MADAELGFILPHMPLPEGGARGGRQQGVEPDAAGGGRPAGAARLRAAHRLVPGLPRGHADDAALRAALAKGIARLEAASGLEFNAARRPLLVSVRSGAAVSMPGMLETVLDVGLNDRARGRADPADRQSAPGLGQLSPPGAGLRRGGGRPAAARRSTRCCTAPSPPAGATASGNWTIARCATSPRRCWSGTRSSPARRSRNAAGTVAAGGGGGVPLLGRAEGGGVPAAERRSDDAGTAVTVQTMVFGNAGGTSGAGVGFTRDPSTGAASLYLDFSFNAQGEDVVAGRRTHRRRRPAGARAAGGVRRTAGRARHAGDAVRRHAGLRVHRAGGRLFLLQARRGKRTPAAALRIAVDMVAEGLITPAEALAHLDGHRSGRRGAHAVRATPARAAGAGGGGRQRRRLRTDRAGCGRGGPLRRGRHAADPAATGHRDRGHRGPGARRRRPDRRRQPDLARRRGGAPARQGVPGRLRGPGDRPGATVVPAGRRDAGRGRSAQPGWQYRRGLSGFAADRDRTAGARVGDRRRLAAGDGQSLRMPRGDPAWPDRPLPAPHRRYSSGRGAPAERTVMAGAGPPSTPFPCGMHERRGWRACARHDGYCWTASPALFQRACPVAPGCHGRACGSPATGSFSDHSQWQDMGGGPSPAMTRGGVEHGVCRSRPPAL